MCLYGAINGKNSQKAVFKDLRGLGSSHLCYTLNFNCYLKGLLLTTKWRKPEVSAMNGSLRTVTRNLR